MNHQTPIIIGIAGRARHGKDTLAQYLVQHHGFHQMAFADPIVDGLISMLDIPTEYRTDKKEDEVPGLGFSYRKAAQTLGTEWGRRLLHPDIWVNIMRRRIADMADHNDRIVISDVRFPNEAAWLRDTVNGFVWHVHRPGVDCINRSDHASESGIEVANGEPVLMNVGDTPDQLCFEAFAVLSSLGLASGDVAA